MRYASGFATGIIALVAAEIVAWGIIVSAPYRQAYQDFRTELPAITRLALSPGWIFGLAAGLLLAAVGLNLTARLSDRSRATSLATLAVLAIGLAIGTAFAGVYPIAQLAGNISSE